MFNKTNRFFRNPFWPHPNPQSVKPPADMREAGFLPYDFTLIPEVNCPWTATNSNQSSENRRVWHPFLWLSLKLNICTGLGCSSSLSRSSQQCVELPMEDNKQIQLIEGFFVRRTFAYLPPWSISYGYLLFQGDTRPQKIGSVVSLTVRKNIDTAVAISRQGEAKR